MEGFYSKKEAAAILGISERQITNYITNKKVRKVKSGNKSWIPHEDVRLLYDGIQKGLVPNRKEIMDLENRIDSLERTVEILKSSLGFKAKRESMSEKELVLFRQNLFLLLSKPSWSIKEIASTIDDLANFTEKEIFLSVSTFGLTAWKPFVDLSRRMVNYIETHADYPGRGLGSMRDRMMKAQDRFFGLIWACRKIDSDLPWGMSQKQIRILEPTLSNIDVFILNYIDNTIRK